MSRPWRDQQTHWGLVRIFRGKRYRKDPNNQEHRPPLGGWSEIPTWVKPDSTFLRATDRQRWENYYRVAMDELNAAFPADQRADSRP